MTLQMAVFNVGRGLCVAFVTPNRYLILVDCGNSAKFSPVSFLQKCQTDAILGVGKLAFTPWQGSDLAYFMVTHPHSDHISDIQTMSTILKPSMIIHRPDLDWNKVNSSNRTNVPLDYYRKYFFWPWDYSIPALSEPVLGGNMTYQYFCLPLNLVSAISTSDTDYVNNSSYVSIIKYAGRTIAITGDITANGLEWLLAISPQLRNAITGSKKFPGVDILIAPHHGHSNDFCAKWFQIAGPTRFFNIVSERSPRKGEKPAQTKVDSRYSEQDFSLGQNSGKRKMYSTRQDGHILVTVDSDGKCVYDVFADS